MRSNIFNRVKNYKGDPIFEYFKIYNFLEKRCTYNYSIYEILSLNFKFSELLTCVYTDFDSCIMQNSRTMANYREIYENKIFNTLDSNTRSDLLDEFLVFCEIIMHLYFICITRQIYKLYGSEFDIELFKQTMALIKTSLKTLGYNIKLIAEDTGEYEATIINPEAENIADESVPSIKKTIYKFLGTREDNLDEKIHHVQDLIDLLEPTFKKFSSLEMIKKAKEYSQLLRHPEIYKSNLSYNWFYEDIPNHLNELFDLCIFTLYYEKASNIRNSYEEKKKKSEDF